MPHYKDGTQAHVGDHVVGKLYNTPGRRAGTIVSITPGAESCNAQVAFLVTVPPERLSRLDGVVNMAKRDADSQPRHRITKSEQHSSAGPEVAVVECVDYCAINELELITPAE